MITEDYVSFETAKLLKEKGFDEKGVKVWYDESGEMYYDRHEIKHQIKIENHEKFFQCPTLQMAMKWLREVHKTEIRVIYDNDRLCWYGAFNPMNESQILLGSGRKCKSYEEAAEDAMKYCLEKLI